MSSGALTALQQCLLWRGLRPAFINIGGIIPMSISPGSIGITPVIKAWGSKVEREDRNHEHNFKSN